MTRVAFALRRRLAVAMLAWLPVMASAQRLALTFDDGLDPAKEPHAAEWYGQILLTLEAEKVKAMFFPALVRIGGEAGLAQAARWGEAGHAIGNHTARHRYFNSSKMTLADLIADVETADSAFRKLPGFRPMLRFPFLKEGETAEKRDGFREWMRSHGYRPAPVSIDASDWYYDEVFRKKAGDPEALAKLQEAYVDHLLDRAGYYDALARRVLGRSPQHVLLLHTNAINANWLPAVIAAFRKHGWELVPATTAFEDPLYRQQPDVLPAGESIVWSLAKQAGEAGLRYPAEDSVYEKPRLQALGLE